MDFAWILENTEDHIVLIQEHWRLPSEIESWKSAAFRKAWTGVWHPAIKTQNCGWEAREIWRSGHI
eukprot:8244019-Heterocapsa_arctica.AAC.1